MSMLIFQVATVATQGEPLVPGRYKVALRTCDDGDCLSTIPPYGGGSADSSKHYLSVDVLSMRKSLPLDEAVRAVGLILGDVERPRSDESGDVGIAASLTLMKYDLALDHLKDSFWVLQRELRREGLDICFDESSVLVGYADRRDERSDDKLLVNLVSRFDRLSDRDGSLIDRSALQGKTVLIIGLGSVGSVVACNLARSGVGRFTIADRERLEWGNVVRHGAGLSDVGRLKTKIVADMIRDRNPKAEIREIPFELASASKETYEDAVMSADVVICATDSRASRLICNRLCIKHGKKVIFGGLTSGAYAGMVFQCRLPETMCYHCFVTSFPEAAADRESDESDYSGGPDGHLALDIEPIANLMAKLAILELQKQVGVVANGLDSDLAAPWFIWINRREGEYAELLPLGSPGTGPRAFRWQPVLMERIEECPHCGTIPEYPKGRSSPTDR
jgi:molybdopterin/thiamine biosynthesis adenylyltransferase